MLIHMDDREQRNTDYYWRLLSYGYDVSFSRDDKRDYFIPDLGIGVERKTIPDFIATLNSGHLFEQLEELKNSCDIPWLALDGDPTSSTKITPDMLFGVEASLWERQRVHFCITYGSLDVWLHKHIQKATTESKRPLGLDRLRETGPRPITPQDHLNHILLSIPGIGPAKVNPLQGMKLIPAITALSGKCSKEFREWIQ